MAVKKLSNKTVSAVRVVEPTRGRGRPNAAIDLIQVGTSLPRWATVELDRAAAAALRTRSSEIRLIVEAELRRRMEAEGRPAAP
jgi:hypothetical protein